MLFEQLEIILKTGLFQFNSFRKRQAATPIVTIIARVARSTSCCRRHAETKVRVRDAATTQNFVASVTKFSAKRKLKKNAYGKRETDLEADRVRLHLRMWSLNSCYFVFYEGPYCVLNHKSEFPTYNNLIKLLMINIWKHWLRNQRGRIHEVFIWFPLWYCFVRNPEFSQNLLFGPATLDRLCWNREF